MDHRRFFRLNGGQCLTKARKNRWTPELLSHGVGYHSPPRAPPRDRYKVVQSHAFPSQVEMISRLFFLQERNHGCDATPMPNGYGC